MGDRTPPWELKNLSQQGVLNINNKPLYAISEQRSSKDRGLGAMPSKGTFTCLPTVWGRGRLATLRILDTLLLPDPIFSEFQVTPICWYHLLYSQSSCEKNSTIFVTSSKKK